MTATLFAAVHPGSRILLLVCGILSLLAAGALLLLACSRQEKESGRAAFLDLFTSAWGVAFFLFLAAAFHRLPSFSWTVLASIASGIASAFLFRLRFQ